MNDVETSVKVLSESGYSSRAIVKKLKDNNINISQSTVIRIIACKTKKRQALANGDSGTTFQRRKRIRTKQNIDKVKKMISSANPPSQRSMAKQLKTSQRTIQVIIHTDLKAKLKKKTKVHKLTDAHKKNRKTNSRKLYENYLAGDKFKYMLTLDEAYFYLNNCNGVRKIFYVRNDQNVPQSWLTKCHESWPDGFMVVGGLTARGTLPLIKIPKQVKVNAKYYIEKVLKPYLEIEVKKLYPGEEHKVTLHHDKASSHTSKLTTAYLHELKAQGGSNYIVAEDIPTKSPDISPMDFFAFGYLKQLLFKRKAATVKGLWKVLNDEWQKITPEMCSKVFQSWKKRCYVVSKIGGEHVEPVKNIHKRSVKNINVL